MTENEISAEILDAAICVHKEFGGPGLLESCYEAALACELRARRLSVETQKLVPIVYRGVHVGEPYRLDMLVESKVIVECKAVEKLNPIATAQVLTYLRLTGLHLGLVVKFGQTRVSEGFFRVVNNLSENTSDQFRH